MGEFTDKLKGRIKAVTGKASGDRKLEAEGELDQAKGRVKGAAEEVKQSVKEARREPKPGEY